MDKRQEVEHAWKYSAMNSPVIIIDGLVGSPKEQRFGGYLKGISDFKSALKAEIEKELNNKPLTISYREALYKVLELIDETKPK